MAYTKHSNGRLFRIPTGSPHCTNKKYSIGVQRIQKLQQPYTGPLQPFFRNKKPQNPYLQILVFLPHLSSSPDLRIISSHTAFSDFSNDRLSSNVGPPRIQWRYRPGFAPGFLFSYGAVTASAGTQTEYLLARTVYNTANEKSIKKGYI